jgi:signal transduction histidine kinase
MSKSMDTVAPEMTASPPNLTPEILVPRLGDYLVEKRLLSPENLDRALNIQKDQRQRGKMQLLGEVLLDEGMIDRPTLDAAVTEQIMQLRAALQETNQQLERRVQERTRELQTALQKLSELNQLKSNFIANISHELRTPLTHIKGYVELLLSGAMGELNDQQGSSMQVVRRSTDRLEQQIEDLIRFSLADRGEFTIRMGPINLDKLADLVISRSCIKAKERKVFLESQIEAGIPHVRGDEEKLSWAILQLLDNAIKFTPASGRVTLRARALDNSVEISIADTGIGIPADRVPEIFEPFHQLDGSATRRYGGTGLGLALVRQIIDAHGTSIRVHSEVGQGTCFHFLLAAVPA